MKFLRFLGWLFFPYVMIFFRWKKVGAVGKTFGVIWAVIALSIGIHNASSSNTGTQSVSAPVQQAATPPSPPAAPTPPSAPTPPPAPAPAPSDNGVMNKAKFDQIQNGMSYEQVTKIIGGPGELQSETGQKGDPDYTVIYSYQGDGELGANAILMFQNDKLENKTQMGLK